MELDNISIHALTADSFMAASVLDTSRPRLHASGSARDNPVGVPLFLGLRIALSNIMPGHLRGSE